MQKGAVVCATPIAAPSATKNAKAERDPVMKQTNIGTQCHFDMKIRIGIDADSRLVQSVAGTATKLTDVTRAAALLHSKEEAAFGGAGSTRAFSSGWGSTTRRETWLFARDCAACSTSSLRRTWRRWPSISGRHASTPRLSIRSGYLCSPRRRQSLLPQAGEERAADLHAVRAVEPVDGAAADDGSTRIGALARRHECAAWVGKALHRRAQRVVRRMFKDPWPLNSPVVRFASRCADLPERFETYLSVRIKLAVTTSIPRQDERVVAHGVGLEHVLPEGAAR
jgi:hypothetical protein